MESVNAVVMAGAKIGVREGKQVVSLTGEVQPAPVGTRSLAVILVNFTDDLSRPFTVDQLQNMVFDLSNSDSVASRYQRNSYGRLNLVGRSYDWVTVDPPVNPDTGQPWTGCDRVTQVTTSAIDAAGAQGFDRYVLVFPNTYNCVYVGVGVLFGSYSWIWAFPNPHLIFHELGHNFGLLHAAYLPCPGTPNLSICTPWEYGDPYDPMGTGDESMHAANKVHCKWIDSSDVIHIGPETANRAITLFPTEGNVGVRDVVIPFNDVRPFPITWSIALPQLCTLLEAVL